ncbi:hypothetical protein K1719_009095 [Acacia pycnantha]|nr:hypothetical protein K1719_009095 [Acacia pycnantha]
MASPPPYTHIVRSEPESFTEMTSISDDRRRKKTTKQRSLARKEEDDEGIVYRIGGRKIAFQSVGPLGCTPSNRTTTTNPSGGCVEFLLAMARRHNRALSVALHKLEKTLPGFKYSIFDCYDALLDMANSPSKYGKPIIS